MKRPAVRGDCEFGPRPCPWVGCRYHLLLEVAPRILQTKGNGLRDLNDEQLLEVLQAMDASCALDLVVDGGLVLEEVGQIYKVTRERIRQIQDKTLKKLKHRVELLGMGHELLEVMKSLADREPGGFI